MRQKPFSKETNGFDWFYFVHPDELEIQQMANEFQLNDFYVQDILQAEHLPKVESISDGDSTFIIARVLDPDWKGKEFTNIPEFTRKLAIFHYEDKVLSIQRTKFDWMSQYVDKPKSKAQNSFQLVCALLKMSFRSFEPLLIHLASDMDFYEQKLFENARFPPFAKSLYNLRRKCSILKRLFVLSSEIIDFLEERENEEPQARDSIDMFQRISNQIEDLNERAVGLINMQISISGQRSNEVMRFLAIYSAFFMPLTFLVGIYGMNFNKMPELSWDWGYYLCWVLMLGIAGFHFWWFRRKKWL